MGQIEWGSLVLASLTGSVIILVSMYILLPAMGLPRLDFTAVTAGWVGATGRYARAVGGALFVLGGLGWAVLYARFWPWHHPTGGMLFSLIPFAVASLTMLPELHRFRVMVTPMPGFIFLKVGGPNALMANLLQHMLYGLCLGILYR